MKILSFGHIPTWAGGKQEQGLANVIYQLAYNMSQKADVDMVLAATDVSVEIKRDRLRILGWTKSLLLKHILQSPLLSILWMVNVVKAHRKYSHSVNIWGFFMKGIFLHYCIKHEAPQLVHLHGAHSDVYVKLIPQNVKVVVTLHGKVGGDEHIPNSMEYAGLENAVCHSNRYSKIYFIASQLVDDFANDYGTFVGQTEVVLNAYDSSTFYYVEPSSHEGIALATVASLSDRKGQMRVLQGIKEASKEEMVKYLCVGGDAANVNILLYNFARKNNIDYTYKGKMKPAAIREFLAGADFMILPSSTEGFGLVYLESIACGVPVILPRNLPIVQETGIIQPGVNAILLDDCSAESIAKALRTLDNAQFDRRKVAESITKYSWKEITTQYVEGFNKILNDEH